MPPRAAPPRGPRAAPAPRAGARGAVAKPARKPAGKVATKPTPSCWHLTGPAPPPGAPFADADAPPTVPPAQPRPPPSRASVSAAPTVDEVLKEALAVGLTERDRLLDELGVILLPERSDDAE
eukprot:gene44031-49787_t